MQDDIAGKVTKGPRVSVEASPDHWTIHSPWNPRHVRKVSWRMVGAVGFEPTTSTV
jgi:hypothetical protein